jgi:hypothetical protein
MTQHARVARTQSAPRRPEVGPPKLRQPYDRRAELARILPLWPRELDDESPSGRRRILAKLRCALRAERRRGIAGHWTYDLPRHVELLRVYRLEAASLARRQAPDAGRASSVRQIEAVQVRRADDQP